MATLHEIESAAMQLAPQERSWLASRLTESLEAHEVDDEDLPPLDPSWIEVAKRRLQELDDGTVPPLDGDEVMKRLWELARQ